MNQQTNNSDLMVSGPAITTSIDNLPDKKPEKKKGGFGKALLVIVCILLVILLALGTLVFCALKDNMPQPTNEYEQIETSSLVAELAKELISDEAISLDHTHLDYFLSIVKQSVNESAEGYSVKDLFAVIEDGKAAFYGRVDVEVLGQTITVPAQIDIAISFADQKIIIDVENVKCGLISAPDFVVSTALDTVSPNLPENFAAENGSITYDVSTLDAMIDEEISKQMSLPDNWLGNLISDTVESVVNVELTGARTEGDQLIIEGSVL